MSKVVDITKNIEHAVSEVICINCKHRFIAVRPVTENAKLKYLECPGCNQTGFVIETGEKIFPKEDY